MNAYEQDKRYYELAEKWKNNTITPAEEQEFANWYLEDQDKAVYLTEDFVADAEAHQSRMLDGLYKKSGIDIRIHDLTTRRPFTKWLPYAAALIGIALAFGIYIYQGNQNKETEELMDFMAMEAIEPGSNRATLTLTDGSTINLSDHQDGIIVGDTNIQYADGSAISQNVLSTEKENHEVAMLALITPKGGQYQIILPDGTKVWLNAASSLKYPNQFSDKVRSVELEGEAYFEVAKSENNPFMVKSRGQKVKVLGTHFNINTYDNDIKTTLLEGSIQVNESTLKPGQQSSFQATSKVVTIKDINAKTAIAWKEGYFYFSGDLQSILDQVSRWYDVKVSYATDHNAQIRMDGRVSRSMTLNKLLTYLQEATDVQLELQVNASGRRVVVK